VRIERVGLEHHGDAALRRRHVVDDHAVDLQRAAGDLLEPGDQRSSVDLPQPEGPTKTMNSPCFDQTIGVRQPSRPLNFGQKRMP
jgi:hypothetical protein